MFARASGSAYVCLRCQHRAIQQRRKWLQTEQITAVRRRWQSAAARAPQEDDDDNVDEHADPAPTSDRPRSGTRFRHWRPPPTAKLGVDALGQPAEVLVLPNRRQKRQRDEMKDQDDVSNTEERPGPQQPRILEAITQESKPVSNDEAIKNIESVKQEIGQSEGELRFYQWTKTREALSHGFTAKQLSSYLNAASGDHSKVPMRQHSRVELAEMIIGDVWKYTRTSQKKEVHVNKTFSNHHIKLFVINQDMLKQQGIILPGVKISKPQKSKRLEISGPVEAVHKTVDQLRRSENKVKQVIFPCPREMGMALHDLMVSSGSRRSRPEDCIALRDLLIESRVVLKNASKQGSLLRVYALDDATIETFLQRLMLWTGSTKRMFVSSTLSEAKLDENCFVPVYFDGPYARNALWHRYISPSLDVHRDAPPLEYPSKKAIEALESAVFRLPTTLLERFVQLIPGHEVERLLPRFSAELGLAIFQREQGQKGASSRTDSGGQQPEQQTLKYLLNENSKIVASDLAKQFTHIEDEPGEAKALQSAFLARTPLLPQFLGQQRPFMPAFTGKPTSQPITQEIEFESTFRLLYKSFDSQDPPLEVYTSTGPNSSITIKKVAFTASNIHQHLALPHLAIDLNFTRSHNATLFRHEMPLVPRFAAFMAQLAQRLSSMVKTVDDEGGNLIMGISPLLDLDLSCLANEPGLELQAQGLVTANAKSPVPPKLPKHALYILARAERVDRAMYHLPLPGKDLSQSPFLLEHVMYTPVPQCPKQETAQALRVVEIEPTVIGDDAEKFEAFGKAAYGTAEVFDEFIGRKTKEMVRDNTRKEEEERK